MKKIKFRAWDSDQNKMIFTFDEYKIMVNDEEGTLFCGGHLPNGDWNEPKLMQYTGLKDKNGIEIYFDDLVEAPSGNIFRVIWYEEEMRIALLNNNSIYGFNVPLYQVIGNIYQDKHLLK